MYTKEITYAGIIPLVGGMLYGAEKALNKKPEYILSYKPFRANDDLYLNYHKNRDVNYLLLDDDRQFLHADTDIVVALCPCAGLSQLNCSKSRGANAPQNDWMYNSTEYVLSRVQPKVLIGENAPALYDGKHGVDVLNKLIEIGKKNGYVFSTVKTNSILHGVPQNRKRSFYYFWKYDTCPILDYSNVITPTLTEYLSNASYDKSTDKEQETLLNSYEYRFLFNKNGLNWRSLIDKDSNKSLLQIIIGNYGLDEYIKFLEETSSEEKYIAKIKYVNNKLLAGLNFRDWTPYVTSDHTATLTGARTEAIHPTLDRLLTYRELMYLMGLPDDMQVPDKKDIAKLFQNVPSNTSAYWINEAVEVIKGNRQFSSNSFLKQNNIKKVIEV